jgi:hypothetical protein
MQQYIGKRRAPTSSVWDIITKCCKKKVVGLNDYVDNNTVRGLSEILNCEVNTLNVDKHINKVRTKKNEEEHIKTVFKRQMTDSELLPEGDGAKTPVRPFAPDPQTRGLQEDDIFDSMERPKAIPTNSYLYHRETEEELYDIDVDNYTRHRELGLFYLVKELGRAVFVKFTQVNLKLSQGLFAKGQKGQPPADVDREVLKFYKKRYTLFERYDEGCLLDREGWFSVTPQCIASHTAERLAFPRVVDCFSGVGGNTIQVSTDSTQFASHGAQVVSIELDSRRIAMAKKNAEIYGVGDKIEWVEGDMLKAQGVRGDVVFMSPPWGGTGYMALDYYSIFR